MKKWIKIHLIVSIAMGVSVFGYGQKASVLNADEFEAQISTLTTEQIVDVRTPDEFAKGHIAEAYNIDANGPDFFSQASALDKSRPVLMYCLSGARSARAAGQLRQQGYTVFELKGGLMQWNAAKKPLVSKAEAGPGQSLEMFNDQIEGDTLVLVDFHAPWCAPCRKMAPELEALYQKYQGKLKLVKINADENPMLTRSLGVEALPGLMLYKNSSRVWVNFGLIGMKEVEEEIRKNL